MAAYKIKARYKYISIENMTNKNLFFGKGTRKDNYIIIEPDSFMHLDPGEYTNYSIRDFRRSCQEFRVADLEEKDMIRYRFTYFHESFK